MSQGRNLSLPRGFVVTRTARADMESAPTWQYTRLFPPHTPGGVKTPSLRNDVNGQLVGSGLDRSVCSRRHSVSEDVWDADPCAYRAIKIVYYTKRGDAHAA